MAQFYLVRHGQASFGSDNYDQLSPLGHQQARWLGEYFAERDMQFDGLITGDLVRHQETGAAGNEQHQGAVFEHPLHREPLLVCRTLAGKQQLKMAANLLGAVGQVTDPVDDLV